MKLSLPEFIQNVISSFEAEKGIKKMWREPLLALLSAKHPFLPKLKDVVAIDHLLPDDILPGAKNIIVYFIPFETGIIESNMKGEAASEEWALAYILTNELLSFISDAIEKELNQHGFRVGKQKPTHNFDEKNSHQPLVSPAYCLDGRARNLWHQ